MLSHTVFVLYFEDAFGPIHRPLLDIIQDQENDSRLRIQKLEQQIDFYIRENSMLKDKVDSLENQVKDLRSIQVADIQEKELLNNKIEQMEKNQSNLEKNINLLFQEMKNFKRPSFTN